MRPKHSLRETKRLGGCEIKFRGGGGVCIIVPTFNLMHSTFYIVHCLEAFSTPFSSIHPTNPPGYYPRLLRAFIALTADVALLGNSHLVGEHSLPPAALSSDSSPTSLLVLIVFVNLGTNPSPFACSLVGRGRQHDLIGNGVQADMLLPPGPWSLRVHAC